MKLNQGTISLLVLTFALGIFVSLTEIRKNGFNLTPNETKQKAMTSIFDFNSQDVKEIIIDKNEHRITLSKNESKNNSWLMKTPDKKEVNEVNNASIFFLLNLLSQAKNELEIEATPQKITEYGLKESSRKISITINNGETYQIILGKGNFDDTKIYSHIFFPDEKQKKDAIFLVSKSFQYAIDRELSEWIINN